MIKFDKILGKLRESEPKFQETPTPLIKQSDLKTYYIRTEQDLIYVANLKEPKKKIVILEDITLTEGTYIYANILILTSIGRKTLTISQNSFLYIENCSYAEIEKIDFKTEIEKIDFKTRYVANSNILNLFNINYLNINDVSVISQLENSDQPNIQLFEIDNEAISENTYINISNIKNMIDNTFISSQNKKPLLININRSNNYFQFINITNINKTSISSFAERIKINSIFNNNNIILTGDGSFRFDETQDFSIFSENSNLQQNLYLNNLLYDNNSEITENTTEQRYLINTTSDKSVKQLKPNTQL